MPILKYYLSFWHIRIFAFLFLFILLIITISLIPIRYSDITTNENLNRVFAYSINFFLIFIPLFLIEKVSGNSILRMYGISNFHKFLKYFVNTFLIILFLFSVIIIANYFLDNCSVNNNTFVVGPTLFVNLVIIFIGAFQEELIFRGFLINSLELRFSGTSSVFLSSLIFAILHIFNANFSFISAINTFLAGVLLGLLYLQSRSIWLPTLYHFFWNAMLPLLLASNVSGINFNYSFFVINQSRFMPILNGGDYGFEASLSATIAIIISIAYFARIETLNPYNSSYKFKKRFELESYLLKNEKNNIQPK